MFFSRPAPLSEESENYYPLIALLGLEERLILQQINKYSKIFNNIQRARHPNNTQSHPISPAPSPPLRLRSQDPPANLNIKMRNEP